jgi:hypothetical protein
MQNNVNDELNRLQSWSLSDQLELLEGLKTIVGQKLQASQPQLRHKARDFRGVGKDTWKNVDVEEYLRQERASWDR